MLPGRYDARVITRDDAVRLLEEQHAELAALLGEFARRRDEEPDDLGSFLLHVEVEGRPMTDLEFGYFFVQLVTAGNDTTRTMLSSGLHALLEHPDELARLRDEGII